MMLAANPPTLRRQKALAPRRAPAFRRAIAARAPYLLRYNGQITSGERFQCPARAGTARCPLVEQSLEFDLSVPTVAHPPAASTAPKCCTQSTITIPWAVTPKIRQKLVWGSDDWISSFARRTHIEGGFGNVKNPNTENLSRGWLQVSGLVRHTLGMAFVLAAYNLRIAQKWNDETGLSTDPVFAPTPAFTLLHEPEPADQLDAPPLAA